MKKIININLSGRVIPIEDSAYEKLQAYIESLRRYFIHEEGRDEIINDIESRIAELMNEKIRKGAVSITDEDLNEIIASMGTVKDFEAAEKDETLSGSAGASKAETGSESTYTAGPRRKTRLYRDSSDKILGGVCSGIANYLNIDPAIVRILFAIIAFGGGLGFLAYIIMWIVLPPRDLEGYSGKRLYRNPEDKIIGGVAGGLAAYFGREAWTVRLIFAAPLILNILFGIFSWPFFDDGSFLPNIVFGSLTGTFAFAYIVLWIVLPVAESQYQRMEMRGEKVDVNSIRQNVKEGRESMKDRVKEWGTEVKESAQDLGNKAKSFAQTHGKAFATEAKDAARRTGGGIAHVFGVLFKAFFLFVAGTIAFGLLVGLLGLIFGGIGVWPLTSFVLDGFWQNTFAWGTLVLFLGVPLVGFFVWLLRRIMRVRSHNNYLGWTFGGLWVLGWICMACFVASMVNDFRMTNERTPGAQFAISQPAGGKMIVTVTEPEIYYSGRGPFFDIEGVDFTGGDINRDTMRISNVRVRVRKSADDSFHVDIKKFSHGSTRMDAEQRAQKIGFNANYRDSVLDLGSGIAIDRDAKFRGQQAIVIIYVPVGKKIRFDETVSKLKEFSIDLNERRGGSNGHWDFDDYFDYSFNVDYTMAADGRLLDPLGVPSRPPDNDYRYPSGPSSPQPAKPVTDTLNKQKTTVEEIKEKQNVKIINGETENNSTPGHGPSAVFSLVDWF
jgi:phage shock protein PspC (stress-responsive transcriptional regulator)